QVRLTVNFSIFKLSESPSARCSIFLRIFDHELNIRRWPRDERLLMAKDFVVFLLGAVSPREPSNNCAVRNRKLSFTIGLGCNIVSQYSEQIVEVAFFMGHRDYGPVTVSGRNFDSEDWRRLVINMPSRTRRQGENGSAGCKYDQHRNDPFHKST